MREYLVIFRDSFLSFLHKNKYCDPSSAVEMVHLKGHNELFQ